MYKNIKAILIDSGRVLNGPVTGEWFITPNFFSFIDKKSYNLIPKVQRDRAFDKAAEYISKQNYILNEEEEYSQFLIYYKIFFEELPEVNVKKQQVEAVTKDLVYNYSKYEFYKDAIETIPKLSERYKLAVVSDAWPSLENVFKQAGLRDYFSSFVISSVKGVTKPHELMYKTALDELGVMSCEAIFIDDSVKNCEGAKRLGIKSFVLCRDWRVYVYRKLTCKNHNIIRNLNELKRFI